MPETAGLIVLVILAALVFDYTNGFHDTANAIATSVSTRVLAPRVAVLMSGVLNFVGALISTGVASTIGKGIVQIHLVTLQTLLAAMVAAIGWNLLTWYFGIPSSSSHALIGGVIGAAVAGHGWSALDPQAFKKVIMPLLVSPPLGLIAGYILMKLIFHIVANWTPTRVNRWFSKLQVLTAAWMSLSHGMADAQKTMGIMTIALVTGGFLPAFAVPLWVKVLAATAMGMGTAAGGWRIVKTLGMKLIRLQPVHGFAAEFSAAAILTLASGLKLPVSTTHVIASTVLGVGTARRVSLVRWQVASNILIAMAITIPMSGILAALVYQFIRYL